MNEYNLEHDEVVIMQDAHVTSNDAGNVTLILTNQSLIQVNKGFLGGNKGFEKYSLLDLKEYKGKPNVLVGKSPNGTARLELFFSAFEKYYVFQSLFTERKWANAIKKAYKSRHDEIRKMEHSKKSILLPITNALNLTRNSDLKAKYRIAKCPRCGAELTGEKGAEVICSYCDSVVKIK